MFIVTEYAALTEISLIPVSQNCLSSFTPAPSFEDYVEVQEKKKRR